MTPERWRRIADLYHSAMERHPDQRAAFLAEACQDDTEVRQEVEGLLRQNGKNLDAVCNVLAPDDATHTACAAGTRLGPFQIEAPLGAGGMGEVFRARDTRLGRTVAIKFVKREFSARFHSEARAIAALNHPNICTLHDTGPNYLVMEFVEGETLADIIRRGPVPADRTVAIARQIGAALEAAHDRGIVHRDLKPANVKITPNGAVKVLDFGLAKIGMEVPSGSSDVTLPLSLTDIGMVLGTPSYMAPEQAAGKRADKRADIWAFGAVLYEMLTGRKAFSGQTQADVLAAVLGREPDWEALRGRASPNLARLIERCLRKDPNRRLRDIGDAQMDLDDAFVEPAKRDEKARRPEYLAWCIAIILAVALITALVRRGDVAPSGAVSVTRTAIVLPTGLKLATGDLAEPMTLSADGRRLAYVAEQDGSTQLYIRELGELEGKAVPGTLGAAHPFFSPDGVWIAFFAAGALQKVAVTGGAPIRICSVDRRSVGGAWTASNQIVFALRQSGLFRVGAAGGTPEPLAGSAPGVWPEILPDGKTVLFTTEGNTIAAIPLAGGQRRIVARGTESDLPGPAVLGSAHIVQVRYLPGGYLVYGQSRGLLRAIAFDWRSLKVSGSPVPMLDSLEQAANGGGIYFALSATGSLVYATSGDRHQLVWVNRSGAATPISSDRAAFRHPRLSPDGKRIAVAINDETRRSDIWIYDAERGSRSRLTAVGHNLAAVWSPDGTRVAFSAGNAGLVDVRSDGSGGRELLLARQAPVFRYPSSWSPDRRNILFQADGPAGRRLWVLPLGGAPHALTNSSASSECCAQFSPDGRWITYSSDESGVDQVYVARFPDMTGKVSLSTEAGSVPQWSRDGRVIFYRQGDAMMAARVTTSPEFRAGKPERLFSGDYSGASRDPQFDVAPNGDRFIMVKSDESSTLRHVVVVQNWVEDVKRRIPPR